MSSGALYDPREWTFDDLDKLPDEDGRRYEIVDGALVERPGPAIWHDAVSDAVRAAIRAALSDDLRVLGPFAIDLHPSYRLPDLVVVRARAMVTNVKLVRPADVMLVVEIVSPSSRTTDRITKPAQYAAAGIPHYWRVETEPEVSLTAYALPATELPESTRVYVETGTWTPGQVARLREPLDVEIVIDELR